MKWFGKNKLKNDRKPNGTRQTNPTDSSTKKVISYYTASRRQLDNFERSTGYNEDPLHTRRRFKLKESWFSIVCGMVVLAAVLYTATLDTTPHITVRGQEYRPLVDYQTVIASAFGKDIRDRFKPTLRTITLEQSIRALIPEASEVTVSSSLLGHRPDVIVVTDSPLAIFVQPGSTDYILSDRGRLLLPSATTTFITTDLPLLQNQTGVKGEAGQQFMRPDEAVAFARLLDQFKADGSKPTFTLAVTPHELLARESGRGLAYDERFLLNDDITMQYGSLRATQNKLKELGQSITEYIDIRLVEKVFYK